MASHNHHSTLEVAPDAKPYVSQHSTAGQPYYAPEGGAGHSEKTICGVRRATFWLTLALIFVILAAGIGGGVGGSLAIQKVKCSSSSDSNFDSNFDSDQQTVYITRTRTRTRTMTADPTATTDSVISVPTDGYLYLDCPSIDNTNIRAFGQTFRVICGQDSAGPDIIAVVSYSILDCARACAAYNTNLQANGCIGATFNSYLAYVDAHQGTCWLKNQTGSPQVDGLPGVNPNSYAQMILQ